MSDLHGISGGESEDRAGEMQFARSSAVRHSPQISSRRADFLPVVFLKGHGDGDGGLLLTHLLDGAGAGILGEAKRHISGTARARSAQLLGANP